MDHGDNENAGFIAAQLNGRLTRRQLATGVLAIPAVGALIAACGSDSNTNSTTAGTTGGTTASTSAGATTVAGTTPATTAATETSAATGATGGTLRVAAQAPAKTLDP